MYKIDFPIDAKQAAVIARRQKAEEERKTRIFNPRQRMIGKDLKALQEQIQEKRDREQRERELDAAWLREQQRQQLLAKELHRRSEEDRLRVWKNVQEFRKTCQRFEDRREFDLNDQRKLQYAARLHDEDVRNGPASMQKFEGEDLSYKQRFEDQEKLKKMWLDAQIAERKQNELEYEQADKLYEQRLREMSLRSHQLDKAEQDARRAVDSATKQYNLALAQEKAEQKKLEQLAEEEANMAHRLNMFHSELLTETTDATSVNGPFKISKDRFKGFTEEMLKVIKEEQWRQMMEKKQREKEERSYDVEWEKTHQRFSLATTIMDKEMAERRKDDQLQLINVNRELAEEQRLRQEYMNNMVYKGHYSDGFFDQFNTTTR